MRSKIYMVIGRRTGDRIIPTELFDYFPLSAEPIGKWSEETDVCKILETLYDTPLDVLTEDGVSSAGGMRNWGVDKFRIAIDDFQKWIARFAKSSRSSRGDSQADVDMIFHFGDDAKFGKAVKYIITWDSLITSILEDSTFFSIAHALESNDDLECSMHLAANLYYKQAMQVMRSYLEDLVLPIRFFDKPDEFNRWKSNDYRVPSFRSSRTRKGLLEELANSGFITTELSQEVADLYGDLNGYIHGAENTLINKLGNAAQPDGHVFKLADFHKWCDYVPRLVEVGAKLLKVNVDQWENFRTNHRLVCTMCHNRTEFDLNEFKFGGEAFNSYTCRRCGNGMTFNSRWELAHRVTFFDRMEDEVKSHQQAIQAQESLTEDVSSVDSIVSTLYKAFSFDAGGRPNWNQLHALFLPGARLITTLDDRQTNIFSFDGFVKFFEESLQGTDLQVNGLQFVEVNREVRTFKNICNVWSDYRVAPQAHSSKQSMGTNSIQMVWGSDQFWILTLLWNLEGELESRLSGERIPLRQGLKIPKPKSPSKNSRSKRPSK